MVGLWIYPGVSSLREEWTAEVFGMACTYPIPDEQNRVGHAVRVIEEMQY